MRYSASLASAPTQITRADGDVSESLKFVGGGRLEQLNPLIKVDSFYRGRSCDRYEALDPDDELEFAHACVNRTVRAASRRSVEPACVRRRW